MRELMQKDKCENEEASAGYPRFGGSAGLHSPRPAAVLHRTIPGDQHRGPRARVRGEAVRERPDDPGLVTGRDIWLTKRRYPLNRYMNNAYD